MIPESDLVNLDGYQHARKLENDSMKRQNDDDDGLLLNMSLESTERLGRVLGKCGR